MKKFGKTLTLLAAGALLFGSVLSSCSSGGSSSDDDPKITLTADSTTVEVYGTLTFKATAEGNELSDVTLNSSDTSVATVSGGTLTAVKAGTTKVTASKDGYETSDAVEITVNAKTTEFSIDDSTKVVITDSGAGNITAKVNDTDAEVTAGDGAVTFTAGSYTVTVSTSDGTYKVTDASGNEVSVKETITITAANNATSVEAESTLQLTASVEGVSWSSSNDNVATVSDSGLVTGVNAGTAVITASLDGYNDGTFSVTVTAEAEENESVAATVFWNVTEYAAGLDTAEATKYTENKTYGSVEAVQPFSLRNAEKANSYTVVEKNDLSCTGYLQLASDGNTTKKALKFTVSSDTKYISVVAKDGSSSKDANITLTDGTTSYISKALTTTDNSDYALIKSDEITLSADTEMYIYNAEAANNGGLNIQAIILWKAVKKNAAPSVSNFTANSTAEGYSITVTDPTGIEYSTDGGTTWADATATITLTTYGTVLFRTKATDDALASSTVSVTVAEYKDTSLPTATAPSADNFTVVAEANGSDGSITLTSAAGIEYLNGETWEAAQDSYTGLAAGTYKFRTAAVEGTSNASDALEVVVGTYTLSVSAETTWDLTDYTTNVLYSGIPVRTGSNDSTVITVTQEDLTGYLGKGLYLVSGVAAEYVPEKGLGYSKWAGDKNGETDDKSGNANIPLPAIQSADTITGPFKVTVTSPTSASNSARSLNFYVSTDASTLFSTAAYSKVLSGSDISYIYTGTDEVYVGLGTVGTDGKVYTNISKIVLTAASTIPDDEFPATAVAFSNDGIDDGKLTLSKSKAAEGYQLETTLTPEYSTDSVTYSVTGSTNVSVSEDGKVIVSEDFTGSETVTVTATAREGVTATLSVTVSASVPLTADATLTLTAASSKVRPGVSTTLTATGLENYTDISSYEWTVDDTVVSDATSSTYDFSSTTTGEHKITVKATSTASVSVTSSEVTVTVDPNYTEYFTKYSSDDGKTYSSTSELTSKASLAKETTWLFGEGVSVYGGSKAGSALESKNATYGSYSTSARLLLDKSTNGGYISIPVDGTCTIYIGHGNNKSDGTVRALHAECSASDASITVTDDSSVTSVEGYTDASTSTYVGNTSSGKNTVAAFSYSGDAGVVKITCTLADGTTTAAGGCYVGVIDVKY